MKNAVPIGRQVERYRKIENVKVKHNQQSGHQAGVGNVIFVWRVKAVSKKLVDW